MSGVRALYLVNGSISSWRVLLALHEKGLPFEARRLRVMRTPRETRLPDFLALNPRGQAPVLVEPDGVVMNESLAILTYLELRYPEPSLLPQGDPAGLARTLAYAQESEAFGLAYEPLEMLFATRPKGATDEQSRALARALDAITFELRLWSGRAARSAFIAGDAFSLADCAFYPVLAYLLRRGLSLADYPDLDAYERRVRGRPCAEPSFPEGWAHDTVGRPDLFALARQAVNGLPAGAAGGDHEG
jgi:glutathione S-transferase